MVIHKYEGSVYLKRWQFRGKIRMYGPSRSYDYRFAEIKPLLQHIKRIHA